MSSKPSEERSRVSQGCQENKEAAGTGHTTQDPLFEAIAYVRYRGWAERKLERDFAAAEDQEFERFSIRDSLVSNKLIPKGLIDILDDQLGPKDHKHEELLAREFITAVRRGDIARLKDIIALCDTFEKNLRANDKRSKRSRTSRGYKGR
jgi:hypothetical protein